MDPQEMHPAMTDEERATLRAWLLETPHWERCSVYDVEGEDAPCSCGLRAHLAMLAARGTDTVEALRAELDELKTLYAAAEESREVMRQLAAERADPEQDPAELLALLEDHLAVTAAEMVEAHSRWPEMERDAIARLEAAIERERGGQGKRKEDPDD